MICQFGLFGDDAIEEFKCQYGGRYVDIKPVKKFPFFVVSNGKLRLKSNHKYYDQIQEQLYISGRKICYVIVFTFSDILILKLKYDDEYFLFSVAEGRMCIFFFMQRLGITS